MTQQHTAGNILARHFGTHTCSSKKVHGDLYALAKLIADRRAIEDEVLDRVRAAVEGLPEHGEWCGQGRGHWIGALTKSVVLDAIEQVRGG